MQSIYLIFTCFGQQFYELCRGVYSDRCFAVILCIPCHDQCTSEISILMCVQQRHIQDHDSGLLFRCDDTPLL